MLKSPVRESTSKLEQILTNSNQCSDNYNEPDDDLDYKSQHKHKYQSQACNIMTQLWLNYILKFK